MQQVIAKLIDKLKFAYLGSLDIEGFPNIKAVLAPRKREGIKTFYFTTNTSSMRVNQYRNATKACIYFCEETLFQGVMLKGYIDVLEDAYFKQMIWQDGDTIYYPQGVTDPDYCVLRFTAESGRYYNNFKSDNFFLE